MAKNSKPKIRINRKSIDEMDEETKKEIDLRSMEDSSKASDPFTEFEFETDSLPLEDPKEPLSTSDAFESPFEEKSDDLGQNPFDQEEDVFEERSYEPIINTEEALPYTTPNVDLVIDPNMPYFFVFGNSTAGKSAMLSGLLYYIQTSRIGQLRSLGLNDQAHHRKGDYALNQMTKKVRNGEFIAGTQTLDTTEFVFPTEINLEFEPNGKPSMPFCLLEMAGEDLKEIELKDEGKSGGDFDARINAYLQHPDCNMKFICVVDVDTPENSEDLINQFLMYIHKAGHVNNPVLITVNKWDKIEDKYESVKDYLEKKLPILTNNLFDDNRDMAYMKFSIGNVKSGSVGEKDTYDFNPEDSKKLLEWMYQTANGQSLNEEISTSILSKIKKYLFK